jgi:hypothetical protein
LAWKAKILTTRLRSRQPNKTETEIKRVYSATGIMISVDQCSEVSSSIKLP